MNKDVAHIFFEPRTGENISLGSGMKVIHYFVMGISLLLSSLVIFLQKRFPKCPYHFGYLARHPKKDPYPQKKCLVYPKVADCISVQPQKQKPSVKNTAKKEKDSSECPHHFGYLRTLPNNQAVPKEYMACKKCARTRTSLYLLWFC